MKNRWLLALVLVLVVVGAAACGSDDPDVDEILNDAEEALDQGLDEAEEEAEDALDAAGNLGTNECLELATAMAEAAGAAAGTAADPEAAVEGIRNLSEVVPPEIADDMVVMAEALGAFFGTLSDAGIDFSDPSTYSSAEAAAALQEASAEFEASGVTEAQENITAVLEDICPSG